jgi:hypothetical protein
MADKLKLDYFLADILYKIIKDGVEAKEEEDYTKEKIWCVINDLIDCHDDFIEINSYEGYKTFPVGYKLTEEDKKLIQEKRKESYIKGE